MTKRDKLDMIASLFIPAQDVGLSLGLRHET